MSRRRLTLSVAMLTAGIALLVGAGLASARPDSQASGPRKGGTPWAPFLNDTQRMVTSRSLGCFFPHPIFGLDIAAVCKK